MVHGDRKCTSEETHADVSEKEKKRFFTVARMSSVIQFYLQFYFCGAFYTRRLSRWLAIIYKYTPTVCKTDGLLRRQNDVGATRRYWRPTELDVGGLRCPTGTDARQTSGST